MRCYAYRAHVTKYILQRKILSTKDTKTDNDAQNTFSIPRTILRQLNRTTCYFIILD